MSKKLIDSIMHFDRFNTDLYREVINTKNGKMEERDYQDEVENPLGYAVWFAYIFVFVLVTILIGLVCFIVK